MHNNNNVNMSHYIVWQWTPVVLRSISISMPALRFEWNLQMEFTKSFSVDVWRVVAVRLAHDFRFSKFFSNFWDDLYEFVAAGRMNAVGHSNVRIFISSKYALRCKNLPMSWNWIPLITFLIFITICFVRMRSCAVYWLPCNSRKRYLSSVQCLHIVCRLKCARCQCIHRSCKQIERYFVSHFPFMQHR